MNEWIKTTEKLPPHMEYFLIWYCGVVEIATRIGDSFWLLNKNRIHIPIEHWMPLPKDPKSNHTSLKKEQ
jgi:hypothetical protein